MTRIEDADPGRGERGPGACRVLVCDDDPDIRRAVSLILEHAGYQAVAAPTAAAALQLASTRPPDVAIVDLKLTDGDGVEVCRRLREWSSMPILVLSATADPRAKVRALRSGADDYVTKPFSGDELVARIEAALRRALADPGSPTIAVDGLEIDLAARVVRSYGREVELTPIEYGLLRVLARNRGNVVSHRALMSEVWGPSAGDAQTLRLHIAALREKIEPPGKREHYIRTAIGTGYRFAK
jgi:two-component system KDP operon response regulator KdpE